MTEEAIQLALAFSGASLPESPLGSINRENNGRANKLDSQDRAFHDWYRFVLSYPPHLVRDYLEDFGLDSSHTVLDPFCGTGTTLVEVQTKRHQGGWVGSKSPGPFCQLSQARLGC